MAHGIAPVRMRTMTLFERGLASGEVSVGSWTASGPLSEPTLHDYLHVLRRLFLIEDQETWKPTGLLVTSVAALGP